MPCRSLRNSLLVVRPGEQRPRAAAIDLHVAVQHPSAAHGEGERDGRAARFGLPGEGRRLGEHLDVTSAGSRVGYDDTSHFNREYKSLFGVPPRRDVERLRASAWQTGDRGIN